MNQNPGEKETTAEHREQRPESRPEQKEPDGQLFRGAELLEEPSDGSFAQGLQVFVAWVKSLVAPNNKP